MAYREHGSLTASILPGAFSKSRAISAALTVLKAYSQFGPHRRGALLLALPLLLAGCAAVA
ncbi:MAG: hypothetical protein WA924_15520, partial [Burkholderiaceae bacterium]